MNTFSNKKYKIWDVDIDSLNSHCNLKNELDTAFNSTECIDAPEKIGEGKTLGFGVLPTLQSYPFLYSFIINEVNKQLEVLNLPLFYRRKKLRLTRCWANRIFKNTHGTIHRHQNRMVMLLYYEIPEGSSELIFVNHKHVDKLLKTAEDIPEEDKLIINPHTGMCVLHDGNILHAVGVHKSDLSRDVIVFEFETVFT